MVRIKKNNFSYNKNIYQCIVPGCQNIDNDTKDSSIYYYIISETGLNQKLLNKFLENLPIRPKVSRICSDHYTDDCFQLYNGIKMLKTNAVPTIRSKPNPTAPIDKINNINRTDKSDESINNKVNEKDIGENKKTDTINDDKVLMGPPQTTVVKKSQLQSTQKNSTILLQLLQNNKEIYQQKQHPENNGNLQQQQSKHLQQQLHEKLPHLQPHNGHLQMERQEQCSQKLQQQRQRNENLQHQNQQRHNGALEKQPILSPPQGQQQNNGELLRRLKLKPLCTQQQQKNNANLKKRQQSKQSVQQNQNNEELKWLQHQKHLKERKHQLKRKKELKKVEQHNRNLSKRKQGTQSKHKQQQEQMEELHRRPEQLWPQQQHQHNRYLQERVLPAPRKEQNYPHLLQRLQNQYNRTVEESIQSPSQQQHHNHQQFQQKDSQNQNQQQYNEILQREKEYQQLHFQKLQHSNQQLQKQNEHLQQEQIHPSDNVYLERGQLSQQQYDCERQMEGEEQLSQTQLQQNILPEHQLLNDESKKQKQRTESQISSPISHIEEHLIMCGYITFESCNNNFSYSCNFCSKNLENLNAFSAHLIRLHSNEIENEINSKTSNKEDIIIIKDHSEEISIEKQKCGIISISSKLYNLLLNCDFKFDCNFCDKKFEAINKFSEHIGKRHLDLLEKDKVDDMEFEDDIELDPSCILSFDEINEFDLNLNSSTMSINNNNNNNNNSNNKIVMSVPISDNSEIFMTIDINENNTNNIINNNNNNNNNLNISNNKEIIEEEQIPMEFDSLDKPKLKVNIKHSSWATRYFS